MSDQRRTCPIIEVRWHDISPHGGGWQDHSDAIENTQMVECRSVGYLIYDGKDRIVLAQNLNLRDDITLPLAYSDTVAIPPGTIISRRTLSKATSLGRAA